MPVLWGYAGYCFVHETRDGHDNLKKQSHIKPLFDYAYELKKKELNKP